MYSEMMKASAGVAMTGGADITPSKKRARKNAALPAADGDDGATTTPKKKRVRKPKVVAATVARVEDDEDEDEDEEEGHDKKKVKIETEGEDEDGGLF